jgi:DNA-binding XRE family transcriptional regulator
MRSFYLFLKKVLTQFGLSVSIALDARCVTQKGGKMKFPAEANWSMRLKLVRTMKNQSQEEMAEIIGTTRKQIYLWESGKVIPKAYARAKMAKWADVPEEVLFKNCEKRLGGK